jgi:NADP-dependent 3-hydroxy acid dehydrogenase YdfG
MVQKPLSLVASVQLSVDANCLLSNEFGRLDHLKQTAKELSESTGQECLPVRVDVRQPNLLKEAVDQTISKFGRIDFVICGRFLR